jgi:cell division protein FtsN
MRNKEFREVQVSSSGLVFIFLAILVLGVFIFLLGVNVGKKQVQMAGPTTILARPAAEAVTEEPPTVPKDQPSTVAQAGGAAPGSDAKSRVPEETKAAVPAVSEKTAPRTTAPEPAPSRTAGQEAAAAKPAATSGTYYIQIGAFNDKAQADTFAARFKGQGYPALVLSPFSTDKRPTYRVRLVGYATKEQASQVMAKLNAASTRRTGYYIRKEG